MANYKSVLDAARSQIGQGNDPDGSNKYLEWYYGYRMKTYWCAIFMVWCFNEVGILDRLDGLTNKAGCEPWRKWAVSKGLFGTTPREGAIVLFDWNPDDKDGADHIGIVESVDGSRITTIEGNTSENGSQSNGGKVLRKVRYPYQIMGYVYVDTTAPANIVTIYGEGTVSSETGVRVHSAPKMAGTATEEVRPYGEKLYCYGTNQSDGFEWWRIDETGKRWVRKTSLKNRKAYKKTVVFTYGRGTVNSLTGVRVFSRPGKAYATEEVIAHGVVLYCYGSNKAEDSSMNWWAVNKERTKWVRMTSLRDRVVEKLPITIE